MNAHATFEGSTLQTHVGLFSQREAQVVTWVGEGKTDTEIGPICGCTPRTAKAHVLSAMRKLDVHTRAQLVAKAFTKGLMS
ncbi:MAG: helix-turn-helix transcriptional regulator, partial [Motiliproteus sp.]|nr:helix-turn-helix transcriptional regulator [Motiliproteus sp.]